MRYVYSSIVCSYAVGRCLGRTQHLSNIRFKHGHYGAKLKCLIRRKHAVSCSSTFRKRNNLFYEVL